MYSKQGVSSSKLDKNSIRKNKRFSSNNQKTVTTGRFQNFGGGEFLMTKTS
jgi:hypothetical protein